MINKLDNAFIMSFIHTSLIRIRSATINGTTYQRGIVLIYAMEDDQPLFGKIEDLIVTPSQEWLFILSALVTYRSYHFHAFIVSAIARNTQLVYRHNKLVDYHPLCLARQFGPDGKLSICLK